MWKVEEHPCLSLSPAAVTLEDTESDKSPLQAHFHRSWNCMGSFKCQGQQEVKAGSEPWSDYLFSEPWGSQAGPGLPLVVAKGLPAVPDKHPISGRKGRLPSLLQQKFWDYFWLCQIWASCLFLNGLALVSWMEMLVVTPGSCVYFCIYRCGVPNKTQKQRWRRGGSSPGSQGKGGEWWMLSRQKTEVVQASC